jgi:hypothetical protein
MTHPFRYKRVISIQVRYFEITDRYQDRQWNRQNSEFRCRIEWKRAIDISDQTCSRNSLSPPGGVKRG